jgi:23S rRNA-/tRNA-specific pseudouridylate synthase
MKFRVQLDLLFSACLMIFSSVVSFVQTSRRIVPLTSGATTTPVPPSFIDANEDKEQSDGSVNGALGTENIIYVDDDIIVVDKPSYCQTAPGFRESDSLGKLYHFRTIFSSYSTVL